MTWAYAWRMKLLRVIDQTGTKQDWETEFVPRIGERVVLELGDYGKDNVGPHYYRVKDVAYHLTNPEDAQATILIEEESKPELWPS
jgi:hypothetical protein